MVVDDDEDAQDLLGVLVGTATAWSGLLPAVANVLRQANGHPVTA